MAVNIYIEEIVVEGVALTEEQRAVLGRSLAAELTAALTEQPPADWQRDWPPLSLSMIDTEITRPAEFGRQLARTLHTGLTTGIIK